MTHKTLLLAAFAAASILSSLGGAFASSEAATTTYDAPEHRMMCADLDQMTVEHGMVFCNTADKSERSQPTSSQVQDGGSLSSGHESADPPVL